MGKKKPEIETAKPLARVPKTIKVLRPADLAHGPIFESLTYVPTSTVDALTRARTEKKGNIYDRLLASFLLDFGVPPGEPGRPDSPEAAETIRLWIAGGRVNDWKRIAKEVYGSKYEEASDSQYDYKDNKTTKKQFRDTCYQAVREFRKTEDHPALPVECVEPEPKIRSKLPKLQADIGSTPAFTETEGLDQILADCRRYRACHPKCQNAGKRLEKFLYEFHGFLPKIPPGTVLSHPNRMCVAWQGSGLYARLVFGFDDSPRDCIYQARADDPRDNRILDVNVKNFAAVLAQIAGQRQIARSKKR